MTRRAVEIVIIGGGVVGSSIAYHLARRGARDVTVLEQATVGSGSSGRAVGGVRQQFSTPACVRMSRLSLAFFHRFEAEMGADPGFQACGYLLITVDPEEMAAFARNVAMQRSLGVDVETVTPAAVAGLHPWLAVDDLAGGAFCPSDGVAGPAEVTAAFARRARELGVQVREGCPALGLTVRAGRVEAVETPEETLLPGVLVVAAGAWSGRVGEWLGVEIPVRPLKREVFVSEALPTHPKGTPMVIEPGRSWYCRREGPGVLMAGGLGPGSSFDTAVDWANLAASAEWAVHRMPPLAGAAFTRAWAGSLDMTPDGNAVLGAVPGLERVYVATGFSGHGFMHSPATGQLMAELILDGAARSVDIGPLALDRFARGAWLSEALVFSRPPEEG
ncbi:MAG TPA: FAD-binding oxidoreductase [Methylomirabilota bacterium]|nr:FAD-binding oxidoreductase [Methylomirabilota bacterium]